eukprot:6870632-Prorocentrum_lima.AAC.1
MTSSLVGSEMCIRDSNCATEKSFRKIEGLIGDDQTLACSPSPDTYSAVSYTHLTLPTICSV